MPQNDLFKRYLDAAADLTAVTQARAEALVKDLVKAGEVQADQARAAVNDLLSRSRKNREQLVAAVRSEVKSQIASLGLASKADIDRFEARILSLLGGTPARKAPTKKKAPAKKKAAAKKAPAKKKAAAKKVPPRKAPAKKRA